MGCYDGPRDEILYRYGRTSATTLRRRAQTNDPATSYLFGTQSQKEAAEWGAMTGDAMKLCIVGAWTHVGYNLLSSIVDGTVFGKHSHDIDIVLHDRCVHHVLRCICRSGQLTGDSWTYRRGGIDWQGRRQEMKRGGGVFLVKKWKIGVFCKKIENGGVFFVKKENGGIVKKWKMGGVFWLKKVENVFLVKSGPFLSAECIMYSISIFYFTFYLFGRCVRTQRTPLPTGLDWGVIIKENGTEGRGIIKQKFYMKRAELSCAGCAQRDRGGADYLQGKNFSFQKCKIRRKFAHFCYYANC